MFSISPLEQDITRKEQVNKLLELKPELDIGKDKKYEIEAIKSSVIYAKAA